MNNDHPPEPWHYITGAVWAGPDDADNPACTAIAGRCSQRNPSIPEQFAPWEKDAALRRIVACVNACAGIPNESLQEIVAGGWRNTATVGGALARVAQLQRDLTATALERDQARAELADPSAAAGLSARELAVVLAALRCLQQVDSACGGDLPDDLTEILNDGQDSDGPRELMLSDEIDELCERINY